MAQKQQTSPTSTVPEGGWGWMVTVGMAIMFISTTGHYTAFGLLFQDFLDKLDSRTTGATVIMNALTAAVNFTGLVTNYLLRTMSYRVVSVIGGLLFSVGIMLTVVADSIIQVVITYSIIAGVGLGLLAPSSYLAFNSYFSERRAIAMGICQAAIGLGFMVAPPVCQYLLEQYSFRGAMLILGGIALNSVVGAMLFRPIKVPSSTSSSPQFSPETEIQTTEALLPMVPPTYDDILCMAVIPEEDDELTNESSFVPHRCPNHVDPIHQMVSVDTECDEHIVISRRGSLIMSAMLNQENVTLFEEVRPTVYNSTTEILRRSDDSRLNQRPMSASLTNFSSTLLMFDNSMTNSAQQDSLIYKCQRFPKRRPIIRHISLETTARTLLGLIDDDTDESIQEQSEPKRPGTFHYILQALSQFLDISLFKDIVYMNIVLGLSLSFVSDSNFFTIFPLHLINERLPRSDIALYISIAAGADVVSRLILPWIANLCHITPRTTYLIACLTSAIARSIVVIVPSDFMPLAVMSGVIGFLKGGMVVNLSLTIGQHCSNEKFAGAYSLFMVITGIMTLSIGSFVGMLSTPFNIHVLSMGLLLCPLMWLIEYVLHWQIEKKTFSHIIKRIFCK